MKFFATAIFLSLFFIIPNTFSNVVQLTSGNNFNCVILDSNQVKCWGLNYFGSLGLGSNDQIEPGSFSTIDLGTTEKVIEVKSKPGAFHACALFQSGKMKCWGFNVGSLGLGDTHSRGVEQNQMGSKLPFVNFGSDSLRTTFLGMANYVSCSIFENGKVKCFGLGYGLHGYPTMDAVGIKKEQMGDKLSYLDFGVKNKVLQIEGGDSHTCAHFEGGGVKCWGFNNYGQSGNENTYFYGGDPSQLLAKLPYLQLGADSVIQLAAGGEHTCALFKSGKVKCWGKNSYGELGYGDQVSRGYKENQMGDKLPYVDFGTDEKITQLYAGYSHNCAVFESGRVKCWGSNEQGALGLGDTLNRGANPNEMGKHLPFVNFGKDLKVIKMSLGSNTTCALFSYVHEIKCVGQNDSGQLGYPTTENLGVEPGQMGDNLPYVDFVAKEESLI